MDELFNCKNIELFKNKCILDKYALSVIYCEGCDCFFHGKPCKPTENTMLHCVKNNKFTFELAAHLVDIQFLRRFKLYS